MARDVNSVILTGIVSKAPEAIQLKSGKQVCLFVLKNIEKYQLADGTPAEHKNFLNIEVFGRNAEKSLQTVRLGKRYVVTGYLRFDDVDGVEKIRVRAFNIQED